jgi:P-type E1-E2 ATPase
MPITIKFPDRTDLTITHLVLDFSGTLASDGVLLPGVAERLTAIAEHVKIIVLTADTYGTAVKSLKGMPCSIHVVQTGRQKAKFIKEVGAENVIAIGNGQNDVKMICGAAIGIAVIGDEGASGDLIRTARVVVQNICNALDLVLNPIRLLATLRK